VELDVRFPVGARRKSLFSAAFKPALKEDPPHMTGYMGGGLFDLERGSGQGVKLTALHRQNASIIFLI
jgi:hypothetical protein